MRTAILGLVASCLILLVSVPPTYGGANEGGFLLLHTDDSVIYTEDEGSYCDLLAAECPTDPDCEGDDSACIDFLLNGLRSTSHRGPETALIWAIAAFPESSCPEVTAVQFGLTWTPITEDLYFVAWEPCAGFEISSDGWPTQPLAGTALGFGTPVRRHAFPIYWFAAYSYYGPLELSIARPPFGEGVAFADDDFPSQIDLVPPSRWGSVGLNGAVGSNPYSPESPPAGACCLAEGGCEFGVEWTCDGEYQGDGTTCDPSPCVTGACCFDGGADCRVLTEAGCEDEGGYYSGDQAGCDPNPCPAIPGACCDRFNDCVVLTGPECEDVDGRYQGEGTTCDPHPCGPPRGACCLDSDCRLDTEENCERLGHGGEYLGNGVPCEPNPCNPTPTLRKSWGEVKSLYRTP